MEERQDDSSPCCVTSISSFAPETEQASIETDPRVEQKQDDSSTCGITAISSSAPETEQASIQTGFEVIHSNTEIQSTYIEEYFYIEGEDLDTNQPESVHENGVTVNNCIENRVGCIDNEYSEINYNNVDLQVVLPIRQNARGNIKFFALGLIVIITMCYGVYYIVVHYILSTKVDFGITDMNSTSFEMQTTSGITPAKIRVLNKELTVWNGYGSGYFPSDKQVLCNYGSYASGFQLHVEQDRGTWHDDSGVTDLQLHCSGFSNSEQNTQRDHTEELYSKSSWTETVNCKENHYIVAFQLRTDRDSWNLDKAGVTNMDVLCRGPGLYGKEYQKIKGNGLDHWGGYGGFSEECNNGSAVCAFTLWCQTSKMERMIDRIGVRNVRLTCC